MTFNVVDASYSYNCILLFKFHSSSPSLDDVYHLQAAQNKDNKN